MPALTNTRHEVFAQVLAQGASKSAAYARAGYKPDRANACRLTANDNVKQRVAELQQSAAEDTQVTVASLVAHADRLRQLAIEHKQFSAAVAAIREIGVLTGLRVDRREVGAPGEFERLSDEELHAFIASETARLIE